MSTKPIDLPNPAFMAQFKPKVAPAPVRKRWRVLSDDDLKRIVDLRNNGLALQDIAEQVGFHLNTVWTHVSRAVARGECTGGRMTRRKP